MVSACLEINTTRDIAHQIVRHRSFSFQEFSQRYANPNEMDDDIFELAEARLQDKKNRQNSIELDSESELHHEWDRHQRRLIWMVKDVYNWALKNGTPERQKYCLGLT